MLSPKAVPGGRGGQDPFVGFFSPPLEGCPHLCPAVPPPAPPRPRPSGGGLGPPALAPAPAQPPRGRRCRGPIFGPRNGRLGHGCISPSECLACFPVLFPYRTNCWAGDVGQVLFLNVCLLALLRASHAGNCMGWIISAGLIQHLLCRAPDELGVGS